MNFLTIFRSIKMAITGKVIQRIDTPIMDRQYTISLRLKRDSQGRKYVVLAGMASGNYQYYPMKLEEFKQLTDAAIAMQSAAAAE